MQCKQCDYPLWNLRARQCPECGLAFVPSEFEFVLNSVRFCCLHCNQEYYGTGEKGHLVPASFACVTCGAMVSMDEMVLLPAEGIAEEQTKTDAMPWVDPRSSRIKGFFSTAFRALFEPPRLARSLPAEPRLLKALVFALLCGVAAPLIGGIFIFALPLVFLATAPGGGGGGMMAMTMVGSLLAFLAGSVVFFLVFLGLWIASAHAILRITGPVHGSIAYTVEPLCYGSAGNFIAAVPCIGFYLSWAGLIWWSVSAILMLRVRQSVSGMRASIAVLALPVVLMALLMLYFMLVFVPMIQGAAAAAQQAQQQAAQGGGGTATTWPGMPASGQIDYGAATTQARDLAQALANYRAREGDWPPHVMMAIQKNDLIAHSTILPGSTRSADDIVIGPMTLGHFVMLPGERQRAFAGAVAASIDPQSPVHRLGDYVFTYAGVDADTSPQLWLTMAHPSEADLAAAPNRDPMIIVVDAGGMVRTIRSSAFLEALDAQNQLRAAAGLPPLPDPRDVGDELPESPDG